MVGASYLRLLLFNLAVDSDDPILAFTTDWANALARHADAIDILTMRVGRIAVADNVRVYSVGREKGYGRLRRLFTFYVILLRLLLIHRYVACFAHMMPLFALLAGPLLWLRGVPSVLWYTHRQDSRLLRWATRFVWRVVSADASSFPFYTPKLRPIGHGIDVDFFSPSADEPPQFTIIQVARLMPIKHQATLLRAVADLEVQVVLVGDVLEGYPDDYKRELKRLVADCGLEHRVTFTGSLLRHAVRDCYARATIAVNLSPTGLFDKAALESMAAGLPTIVSNPAFDPLLGEYANLLRISHPEDVFGLRQRIERLMALSSAERKAIGASLRKQVATQHALEGLVGRLWRVITTGEH